MSVVIFIIVLSILVIVHEWGHYITAKKLGIAVEKFSVGFGPKLFGWMSHGTEFMVCAIPLGGYVKLAGDDRTALKGRPEEFYSHPIGHRALVIVMGPVINVIFAYVCFYLVFLFGFPMTAARIGEVRQGYPAASAGIMKNDVITQIDDKTIASWEDMQGYIFNSPKDEIVVKLRRDGQELTKVVALRAESTKNYFNQTQKIKVMGVQRTTEFLKEDVVFLKHGPLESLGKAAQQMVQLTVLTFKGLYHVIVGSIPAKDAFAGPIRIFDIVSLAAERGLIYLILIMGIISANLAIFNLFPVPVLDGGHLLFLAVEKLRNQPLSLKVEENFTKVGLGLLLTLMLFVIYNDIDSIGWLAKLKDLLSAVGGKH